MRELRADRVGWSDPGYQIAARRTGYTASKIGVYCVALALVPCKIKRDQLACRYDSLAYVGTYDVVPPVPRGNLTFVIRSIYHTHLSRGDVSWPYD